MLTIASWNMNRTKGSWSFLRELRDRYDVDVFLLQEAGRPTPAPRGFGVEPDPAETDRWKILPQRLYCSAIAATEGAPSLRARRPIPLREAKAHWGEFVASHPGQFAVGDIETSDGTVVTVVSLYGIWDKIPETGELFAEATLHRAISDLAVVFQGGGADKILVAGDLNVWHAYAGQGEPWVGRFATVFDRLASFGLELLGPFRPEGMPVLEGCPCNTSTCRHVNTFRYQRKVTATPYQNDYIFGTASLKRSLIPGGCFAVQDEDVWDHSDHRPVIAQFEFDS
jgi:hypothetical protein